MARINFKGGGVPLVSKKPPALPADEKTLDELLQTDDIVATMATSTDYDSPDTTVAIVATVGEVNTVATGATTRAIYDTFAEEYPELVRFRSKEGTTARLKREAVERKFRTTSRLCRAAIEYALSHDDFKEGWDK